MLFCDCKLPFFPSIRTLLLGLVAVAASSAGNSRRPPPQQHFLTPPWGSGAVPRSDEIHHLSSESWVYSGVSSELDLQRATSTGSFCHEQQLYSELPLDVQTPPLISKVEPSSSNEMVLILTGPFIFQSVSVQH